MLNKNKRKDIWTRGTQNRLVSFANLADIEAVDAQLFTALSGLEDGQRLKTPTADYQLNQFNRFGTVRITRYEKTETDHHHSPSPVVSYHQNEPSKRIKELLDILQFLQSTRNEISESILKVRQSLQREELVV